MEPMNPEVKALWLTALRSGEYDQTRGVLCKIASFNDERDGYCCLGVLTDLALKAGIVTDVTEKTIGYRRYRDVDGENLHETATAAITRGVRDWAGLSGQNPKIRTVRYRDGCQKSHFAENLADLNDVARYTFAQIADVIEEQF